MMTTLTRKEYLKNLKRCELNIKNTPLYHTLDEGDIKELRSYFPSYEEVENAIEAMIAEKINEKKTNIIGIPKLVVVVAPPASGKSSLNEYSMRKLGSEAVLINSDEIKLFCPKAKEFANHPKLSGFYSYLTDIYSNIATPILFATCVKLRFSIVFEVTGKNARILQTLDNIKGYRIKIRVMGVSAMTCLVSIMGRYCNQRMTGANGRLVRVDDFLTSYEYLPMLLSSAERDKHYHVEVFTRGIDAPIKLYSSNDRQGYQDAMAALAYAREYNNRVSKEMNIEKIAEVNRFLLNNASENVIVLTELFNILCHVVRLDQVFTNDDF